MLRCFSQCLLMTQACVNIQDAQTVNGHLGDFCRVETRRPSYLMCRNEWAQRIKERAGEYSSAGSHSGAASLSNPSPELCPGPHARTTEAEGPHGGLYRCDHPCVLQPITALIQDTSKYHACTTLQWFWLGASHACHCHASAAIIAAGLFRNNGSYHRW